MKWSLQQLQKINSFPYSFDTKFDFHKNILGSETIYDIDETHVYGKIFRIDENTYQFDFHIQVKLIMACSLTLEDVDYVIDQDFSEVHSTIKNDDYFPIEKNTIDLEEMVWGNIVLSLPIRIVRSDAYEILKARGIEVLTDEDIF